MQIFEKLKFSRRSFFVLSAILMFGAGALRRRFKQTHEADLIVEIVRRNCSYVTITDSDLHRFAGDYAKEPEWRIRKLLESRQLNLFYSLKESVRGFVSAEFLQEVDILERRVVTDFLIATGYFFGETRPGKVLHYQGDQKRICKNPFAVFTPVG